MTITVYPVDAVSGSPTYLAKQARQAYSALAGYAPSGRPLGANSGVRPGTPTTTVTATSTVWTVGPHSGVLDLEVSAAAGPYLYAVDANVTGAVTAANATNPRIDLISAQLSDPSESDGSSTPGVAFIYIAGTAASSPSAPATPDRAIPLAQINVPASGGGSPTVTWVAQAWNRVARACMTKTSAATIVTSTSTPVTGWAPVTGDVALVGSYSTGVRTIQDTKVYAVTAQIGWQAQASPVGIRAASLVVNGATVAKHNIRADATYVVFNQVFWQGTLHAGDLVQITVFQSQGSGQSLDTADGSNTWQIVEIGPA